MRNLLRRLGNDLLHLIAPAICPSCDAPLADPESTWCSECRISLEPAPYPDDIYTELVGHLGADQIALSAIGSLYSFRKESPVQRLIHALKYQGCRQLGVEMGAELGRALMIFPQFANIEVIVPVPLHPARRRERGYNQSEGVAEGLATVLSRASLLSALARTRHTPSQTTLGARDRRNNVSRAFRVVNESVRGTNVLLCDDVCTTGATLNACAEQLLAAGARTVYGATLAKDIFDPAPLRLKQPGSFMSLNLPS
jgi:ComF family protein